MPMWLELIILLLAVYALGFLLGWSLWGRTAVTPADDLEGDSE